MKEAKKKKKPYRVWFEQVNQTYIDVEAESAEEAKEDASWKWRRSYGWPNVIDVKTF